MSLFVIDYREVTVALGDQLVVRAESPLHISIQDVTQIGPDARVRYVVINEMEKPDARQHG